MQAVRSNDLQPIQENLKLFNRLKDYYSTHFLEEFKAWLISESKRIAAEYILATTQEKRREYHAFFYKYDHLLRAIKEKRDDAFRYCVVDLAMIKANSSKIDLQTFRDTLQDEKGKLSLNFVSLKESAFTPEIRDIILAGFLIQYKALTKFSKFMSSNEHEIIQDLRYLLDHQGLSNISLFAFQRFVDLWVASAKYESERPDFPNIGFMLSECEEYQKEIDIIRGNVEYLLQGA